MLAPINDYYTEEEYFYVLKMMRRTLELQRAVQQAQMVASSRSQMIKTYKDLIQDQATQTKMTIIQTKEQLDSAIKGRTSDKINETVDKLVASYDNII